jgi:hypothetical protein
MGLSPVMVLDQQQPATANTRMKLQANQLITMEKQLPNSSSGLTLEDDLVALLFVNIYGFKEIRTCWQRKRTRGTSNAPVACLM